MNNKYLSIIIIIALLYLYGLFIFIFDYQSIKRYVPLVLFIQTVSMISSFIIEKLMSNFNLYSPKKLKWFSNYPDTFANSPYWQDTWIDKELSSYLRDSFKRYIHTWEKRLTISAGIMVFTFPYTFISLIAS